MDLDEVSPGSPASNSSSSFSEDRDQELNNEELQQDNCSNRRPSRDSSTGSSERARRSYRSLSSPLSSDNDDDDDDDDDDDKSIGSGAKTKSSNSDDEKLERSELHVRSRTKSASSKRSIISSNGSQPRSRSNSKDLAMDNGNFNVDNDDLSDVSDMESIKRDSLSNNQQPTTEEKSNGSVLTEQPIHCATVEKEESIEAGVNNSIITDLRQKLDQKKNKLKNLESTDGANVGNSKVNRNSADAVVDLVKSHDEDALDFEAEEGECQEVVKGTGFDEKAKDKEADKLGGKMDNETELEEGEVTDEEEKRPEETEPKPVCRFYTRGQCTWGMSCRFLHPGVTDKGNYTMFDLVRAVPVQGNMPTNRPVSSYLSHSSDYNEYRTERSSLLSQRAASLHAHQTSAAYPLHSDVRPLTSSLLSSGPVLVESAWERGLRTAKEMMRKANKRKEQDMDFEDKKMNLTLSPDELEKDPYYLKERVTPPKTSSAYSRHVPEIPSGVYSPPDRFSRGLPVSTFDDIDLYGRSSRYRELPPHRMPHYEDERRVRPTREVIVQRVEQTGRADEWNDPWMRSKSPGGRGTSPRNDKRRRDRSYSSNSYSSSSSSESDSSSETSHSKTPSPQNRHYNSSSYKSLVRRHTKPTSSPTLSMKRGSRLSRSPNIHRSSIVKRSGRVSLSPVMEKNSSSAFYGRKKPIPKQSFKDKMKIKHRHTSSSTSETESSESSASGSESNSGSSTSSVSKERLCSKRSRGVDKISNAERNVGKRDPPKKRSPISIEIKKLATVGASALTSPTASISPEKDTKKTRREELLKQLRAVEDAIAKKRSKLT